MAQKRAPTIPPKTKPVNRRKRCQDCGHIGTQSTCKCGGRATPTSAK